MRAAGLSAIWSILGTGAGHVLRLGSNLLMTRLLAPEAFGLIGIAVTINYAVSMMADIGLNSSIIRSDRGEDPTFLRTVWMTSAMRGLLVFSLIALGAGGLWFWQDGVPPESIYAVSILPAFIVFSSCQVIIGGLFSPNLVLAQRRLKLGRVIGLELVAQVLSITTMVAAATLLDAGPWSLAIGMLTASLVQCVGSHTVVPGPRMGLDWSWDAFWEVFHFGKWLLLASLFTALMLRGDQVIFGYLFEAETFSLYVIAGIWVSAVIGLGTTLLARVSYPAISAALRESQEALEQAYVRIRAFADIGAICAFAALFVGIGPFFEFFYPQEYEGAVRFVRLLSVSILFFPYKILNNVILSSGDSRRYTFVTGAPALAALVLLPLMDTLFGTDAAVLTFALIQALTLPFSWTIARRRLPLHPMIEARMLVLALAAAAMIYALA